MTVPHGSLKKKNKKPVKKNSLAKKKPVSNTLKPVHTISRSTPATSNISHSLFPAYLLTSMEKNLWIFLQKNLEILAKKNFKNPENC